VNLRKPTVTQSFLMFHPCLHSGCIQQLSPKKHEKSHNSTNSEDKQRLGYGTTCLSLYEGTTPSGKVSAISATDLGMQPYFAAKELGENKAAFVLLNHLPVSSTTESMSQNELNACAAEDLASVPGNQVLMSFKCLSEPNAQENASLPGSDCQKGTTGDPTNTNSRFASFDTAYFHFGNKLQCEYPQHQVSQHLAACSRIFTSPASVHTCAAPPINLAQGFTFAKSNGSVAQTSAVEVWKRPNAKKFPCLLCDRSFSRQYHLEQHYRAHTGERPFACRLCLRRFTTKNNLRRHMSLHSSYKPFRCHICDRTYIDKYNLKRHMLVHS